MNDERHCSEPNMAMVFRSQLVCGDWQDVAGRGTAVVGGRGTAVVGGVHEAVAPASNLFSPGRWLQLQLHGDCGDGCTGPAEGAAVAGHPRTWWWRRCHKTHPSHRTTDGLHFLDRFAIPTKHTDLFILKVCDRSPWKVPILLYH
jgi:hypothetical protein